MRKKVFTYEPVGLDRFDPACSATPGQKVRVVDVPGCPKSGTMGQCYIEDAETGVFLGMASIKSLRGDNNGLLQRGGPARRR